MNIAYRNPNLYNQGHGKSSYDVESLKKGYEYIVCPKGHLLFQEGSTPWGLYYICEGKIKLYKYGSEGKEQITRIAAAGDFVGYSALLHNVKYNISAAVLEDVTLTFVPKHNFLDIFQKEPKVAQHFTHLLCQDVIEMEQRLLDQAYRPVRGRLAEALLTLDQVYEKENSDEESFISLSRQDLASLLGAAKETVIRLLSEFKEEEMITTNGHVIAVLNPHRLEQVSHLYD